MPPEGAKASRKLPRVLIVDDDPGQRSLLTSFLGGQGFETITVSSGEQALNLKNDRVNYWLDNGAQPSDTVRSLLRKAGVLKARHEARLGRKLQSGAVPVAESKSEA